jgi:hypothetical protein
MLLVASLSVASGQAGVFSFKFSVFRREEEGGMIEDGVMHFGS